MQIAEEKRLKRLRLAENMSGKVMKNDDSKLYWPINFEAANQQNEVVRDGRALKLKLVRLKKREEDELDNLARLK